MSMNDGGGMMELALLFGLVVFIVIGFVVLYLLYKFLKWYGELPCGSGRLGSRRS